MRSFGCLLFFLSSSVMANSFWQDSSFFDQKEKKILHEASQEDFIYKQKKDFLRRSSEKRLNKLLEAAVAEQKNKLESVGVKHLSWPSEHNMLRRKTEELIRY